MKRLLTLTFVMYIVCSGSLNAAAEQHTELIQALNAMIEKRELDALISDEARESVKQLEHYQLESMYWRCLKYREALEGFESLLAAPEKYQSFREIEACVSAYANKNQCVYPVALQRLKQNEQQASEKKNNPDRQEAFEVLKLLYDSYLMSSMISVRDAVDALPDKNQEAACAYLQEQKTKISAVCAMLQRVEDEVWEFQTQEPIGYVRK
jgi:hypothetical protein